MATTEETAIESAAEQAKKARQKQLQREESLEAEEAAETERMANESTDLFLPPGRMHAVKGHHRLQGSGSNLTLPRSGSETPRSRSKSPSLKGERTGTATTQDANSSISSLEDISAADHDILTDRAGIMDDLAETVRKMHNSRELISFPPTVNERMTEDTLEDIHAFSDCIVRSSNASRVSVVSSTMNDGGLEPLDECEEGSEDDDLEDITECDSNDPDQGLHHPTVILTNMENLTLQHPHQEPGSLVLDAKTAGSSTQGV